MRKVLLVVGVILCWITAAQSQEAPIPGRFARPSRSSSATKSNNPSTPPSAQAESLAANSEEVLAITSYSPKFGPPGTVVTIQGTGFGPSSASSYLSAMSPLTGTWTTWPTTSWSDTEITASVPANMRNGLVYLNATVNRLQSIGTEPFTVGIPPIIGSYSPLFGPSGTVLTIHGTGFGASQGSSLVSVYSAVTGTSSTWKPTSWSDTEIVVPIPASTPNGLVYLSVTADGLTNLQNCPYTVGIPPVITSYLPLFGPAGTVLTIDGTGFGASQGSSFVSIYSTETGLSTTWKATSWSDTQIAVSVPSKIGNGLVYLGVNVKGLQSIETSGFMVGTPPILSSYSPGFGKPGTVVTIDGTGFGAKQGDSYLRILSTVTGTYTTWSPTSWSDTEIVAPVPTNMPLGKVYLSIEVNEAQSLGWDPFTVGIPPLIASYSPLFGPAGTVLTIYGTGFGASQGSSSVSVYSAVTHTWSTWKPTSWSDTEIVVPAPATMPNGLAYLAVTVGGLANLENDPYSVGIPPVVTSYSPLFGPQGTVLTIHGTGFGASQGSSFVSFYSTVTGLSTTWKPTSWSDTEIVVPAPATMPNGLAYLAVTVGGLANLENCPYTVQ
jgi:IPT/TIG domain